jgi:ubiquinone/menaquinone biosynthesis C-methylase UbiE
VHEVLASLGRGQRVLDIGSGAGSFDAPEGRFITIRADLDRPSAPAANFTQADAAHLPFPPNAFDAVISNHSLEHFDDLAGALAEIARVVKPDGALYVAVPDASTFRDRLYRWLGEAAAMSIHLPRPKRWPRPSSALLVSVTWGRARSARRFLI